MSQSKDISTALLKAFETMNKNNATQAQTSNVIECAISAVVDNAAGIYTVQYQNSSFNIFSELGCPTTRPDSSTKYPYPFWPILISDT